MRHEYVGDVGDFGKYALLNALAGADLSLGVVWYLNTCVESNNDGRFTDYRNLRSCNPYLHDQLLQIRAKGRSLEHVEAAEVLRAGTRFYRESVPFTANPCFSPAARDKECARRKAWHEEALRKLAEVELVFLDPDNGLAGTRVKPYSQRSVKYAFREEVGELAGRGQERCALPASAVKTVGRASQMSTQRTSTLRLGTDVSSLGHANLLRPACDSAA